MYQMSATRELRSPDDAEGLVFRVQSSTAPINGLVDRLGITAKVMAFSKVYDALASGEVEGQYNTWSNIATEGFYLEQAAIVETNHGYLGYPVIMSKSFLDKFPADTRQRLIDSFRLVTHERNRFAFEINQQSRLEILEDGGRIIRLSDEEQGVWRDRLAPIQEEWRNSIDAALIESAQTANANAKPFRLQLDIGPSTAAPSRNALCRAARPCTCALWVMGLHPGSIVVALPLNWPGNP